MVKAYFSRIDCIKRTVAVLLSVILFISVLPVSGFATGTRTGRSYVVGANRCFGTINTGAGFSGFTWDYLQLVAKFTGNEYSFLEGTPEELFDKLLNGEIDIIPCVSKSEVEAYADDSDGEKIGLVSFPIFTKYSSVYVYDKGANAEVAFSDTEAIRKMKIGYLSENEKEYFVDGKFIRSEIDDAEFVPYENEDKMQEDFVSGNVDAVVKSCFTIFPDQSTVYRFNYEPCYFAVRAGETQMMNELNFCMEQIAVSAPDFSGITYEKYISYNGAQKSTYSDAEKRYLESHSEFTIAYNMESDITNNLNSSYKVDGAPGYVFDRISEITGLNVKILPCDNLDDCLKLVDQGKADAAYGDITSSGISDHPGYLISLPVVRSPVVIVGRSDSVLEKGARVATFCKGSDIKNYIRTVFAESSVMKHETAGECLDDVVSGKSDIAVMGVYDFLYLRNSEYPDLEVKEVCPVYHEDCFAVKPGSEALMGIIGKTLSQISGSSISVDAYSTINNDVSPKGDRNRIIVLIGTGLLALAVVVIGFMVIMTYRNHRRSQIDVLTGGRTREKFVIDASRLVKRSTPEKWALVVIDIDKFKFINDRLGYDEGNKMLERVYKTLSDNMEGQEICAHISNDNFAFLIVNSPDNDIQNRLNAIFAEFDRRNALYVKYPVVFSAGVCRLGQCEGKYGEVDINIAIDRCILAKKTVKALHGNSVAFYDGKVREAILREKDIENLMPQALEKHEFMCYIQPKYGTKSCRIEGGEALIRWNSTDYGFIYPDQFIPVAEKNGFVVELDFFILEEVCKAMRRWLDMGLTPVVISVNQSRMHLNNDDYIWRLREIVDKYEVPYEYLELELTESVFTDDAERMLKIMHKLHDVGFKISIDDFGSGYSSLNMLKDIPADVVKIDREFFNGTVNSEKGRAVISTVVDLAKNLKMDVISEGVETREQVEFLQEIDCNLVQGYYFAKPMPMADFEKLWFSELEESKNQEVNEGEKDGGNEEKSDADAEKQD